MVPGINTGNIRNSRNTVDAVNMLTMIAIMGLVISAKNCDTMGNVNTNDIDDSATYTSIPILELLRMTITCNMEFGTLYNIAINSVFVRNAVAVVFNIFNVINIVVDIMNII